MSGTGIAQDDFKPRRSSDRIIEFSELTYNAIDGCYRDKHRRIISSLEIRGIIDEDIEIRKKRFRERAERVSKAALKLSRGEIKLKDYDDAVTEWYTVMVNEIRALHLAEVAVGKGGFFRTLPGDLERVDSHISQQIQFLNRVRMEVLDNPKLSRRAPFVRDCDNVGEAGRGTYEEVKEVEDVSLGFVWAWNRLEPSARHCRGALSCCEQSRKGVVPWSEIVPIGFRPCRVTCRCHVLRYRTKAEAETARARASLEEITCQPWTYG